MHAEYTIACMHSPLHITFLGSGSQSPSPIHVDVFGPLRNSPSEQLKVAIAPFRVVFLSIMTTIDIDRL